MNVKQTLDSFFLEYGGEFQVLESGRKLKGILSKKTPYQGNELKPQWQELDDAFCLYFSSGNENLNKNDILRNGEKSYKVYHCESFSLSDRELYKVAYLRDVTESRGIYEQH